ncbi:TPA: hypothetical protein ACFP38_002320, partial [Neisseria subflava]
GTEAMYANPQLAEILGDAMGVVFQSSGHKTAYIMGDTVWTADVNKALNRYKPDYLIMNTGYALISGISDGIIMGTADVLGVVCGRGRNPTLRLWPTIFSGKIDVFPGDRRSRLISSMTSVAPA